MSLMGSIPKPIQLERTNSKVAFRLLQLVPACAPTQIKHIFKHAHTNTTCKTLFLKLQIFNDIY